MKKRYYLTFIILAGLLALIWLSLTFWNRHSESDVIKIGADYALTGNLASYGEWANHGINMAVEQINAAGGINGRRVEVVFEDSQGDPAVAVAAYRKLIDYDKVKYVITFQSSVALAVAPLANADRVVQMDVSATTPDYSSPDDYTFRTGIVANQLASEAALYLTRKKIERVGVLYINNDFGVGMSEVFTRTYPGEIVSQEGFAQDSTDFRTLLTKMKRAIPEAIFLVSHLKEAGLLVKQARDLGLLTPIVSDVYAIEGEDFLKGAGAAAEGVIYLAPTFASGRDRRVADAFIQAYHSQYNEQASYFAAQAYDGLLALAEVLHQCDYHDTQCARDRLFEIDVEGASGQIKFDRNGDVIKPVEIRTVKDATFISLIE